jgi:leucyl aminopeptidase
MFKSIKIGSSRSATTVLGVWQDSKRVPTSLSPWKAEVEGLLAQKTFSGKRGQTVVSGNVLLVGLGKKGDLDSAGLRSIGGSLIKTLNQIESNSVDLRFHATVPNGVASPSEIGQGVVEGMNIANWRVDMFDGVATTTKAVLNTIVVGSQSIKCVSGMKRGVTISNAINDARRIAATPPNICNPPWMAKEAKKIAKKCGLGCKIITFAKAKELGLNGIVNVGMGSAEKPCMIILEHKPKKKSSKEHLCLVGKTITYDTGGYSLKISNGMKGMKYDKNGGMAVLGAMEAIANLKVPTRVTAILPCAENMVSSNAYRPDDIIKMYNGVSVEVTNTDAEGRLVLADGLAWGCKHIKPTAIVDVATLTGGVVVALGSFCAGLWCNDAKLRKRVEKSAENSGERVWQLPLWEEHRNYMRAKHADIHNSAPARGAHPIQGAAFLSFFVDEDIPWAHIDIAGVSSVERDRGLFCAGPTGWGVRLLTNLAESF